MTYLQSGMSKSIGFSYSNILQTERIHSVTYSLISFGLRVGRSGSPSEISGKRIKKQYQSKTIKVVISFATRIPLQSIALALRGQQSEQFQEAVRVLDVILRQNAAKK